jgi:hypothetical protein
MWLQVDFHATTISNKLTFMQLQFGMWRLQTTCNDYSLTTSWLSKLIHYEIDFKNIYILIEYKFADLK